MHCISIAFLSLPQYAVSQLLAILTKFHNLQGFCAAVSLDLLTRYLVTPRDLAEMIGGSSNSWRNVGAIQDIFHVVQDRQLQQEFAVLYKCLWEVSPTSFWRFLAVHTVMPVLLHSWYICMFEHRCDQT